MIHFGHNTRICSFLRLKIAHLSHVDIFLRAKLENILHFRLKVKVPCSPLLLKLVTKNPSFPPKRPTGKFQNSAVEGRIVVAFEDATRINTERFNFPVPLIWKVKRALNVGSERKLKEAVDQVQEFAKQIIKEKKAEVEKKLSIDSVDLLSRFLSSGHSDEDFVTDIVISFILAGQDTTFATLTWFFWLVFGNPNFEKKIIEEIKEKSESPVYAEVKDMVYTHASLCETMRLYPRVPIDTKEATEDDVLLDKTVVRKGTRVTYHPYAMGRIEEVWGSDWAEFKPKRWLERDGLSGKWNFVGKDSYTYPVFQAGLRICLGKEMDFLQMKRVVASVLRRFKVAPAIEEGVEPVFLRGLEVLCLPVLPLKICSQERGMLFSIGKMSKYEY